MCYGQRRVSYGESWIKRINVLDFSAKLALESVMLFSLFYPLHESKVYKVRV